MGIIVVTYIRAAATLPWPSDNTSASSSSGTDPGGGAGLPPPPPHPNSPQPSLFSSSLFSRFSDALSHMSYSSLPRNEPAESSSNVKLTEQLTVIKNSLRFYSLPHFILSSNSSVASSQQNRLSPSSSFVVARRSLSPQSKPKHSLTLSSSLLSSPVPEIHFITSVPNTTLSPTSSLHNSSTSSQTFMPSAQLSLSSALRDEESLLLTANTTSPLLSSSPEPSPSDSSLSDSSLSDSSLSDSSLSDSSLSDSSLSDSSLSDSSPSDSSAFGTSSSRRPSPHEEFRKHAVFTPVVVHGRSKRHIPDSTWHEESGEHHHDITLGLTIDDENVLVDLQLNRGLLPHGYFEKRLLRNGSHVVRRPTGQDAGLCHYQGTIRDKPGSWAALSTCHGLSGMVYDGNETHYVERLLESEPSLSSPHYLLSHKHLLPRNLSCGYKGHNHSSLDLFKDENFAKMLRYKRSTSNSLDDEGHAGGGSGGRIRGPYNSNSLSRYVELVLVADHLEFQNQGEDVNKIHKRFKDIANIANALYQPLNIFIALVGVEVWQEEDQVVISQDGDQTLTNFLNYRKVRLIPEHPNDNAQLLTGQVFDSGVVGKALKGPICTYQYSGGVNMDHSSSVGLVATTVAHEMGHNFGMEHDTEEDCQCPDSRCIMAPSSGSRSPSHWSSCSHEYLALSFERSMDYCLRNKPRTLFDSPVCGNSFVEPGEQCDCGLSQHCTNPCCDPETCLLYPNATCATGQCCDLQTCRPKEAGTECRSAHRECDLPEYCRGDSEYCPDDVFQEDGHECHAGKAFCHSGMCRSHEQQCQLLWGPTGQNSHDDCYSLNTQGNNNGNCGYNWANDTYSKCSTVNRKCGMMHCKHFNERLEFGMESVSKVSHRFIQGNEREIIPCRVAQVDLGLDMVDPGLAPDGAKCGYQKMCVNQVCMPVASLRKEGCNCHGNGACNNLGHCHCALGFAPPDCVDPGYGGSIDSGPASNPNATNKFVVGLFVFFFAIIPLVVVSLCLVYYVRGNLGLIGLWLTKKGLPGSTR
ncbi:Peptidase M12B ADAM/reprolysin [Trinorchestia longiramus]|nr:Peptidase M12B ADAM/reprolysin [Trinorchestia longiramus]